MGTRQGNSILFCKWYSICEDGIDHAFRQLGYQVDEIKKKSEEFDYDYDRNYLRELSSRLQEKPYVCVFSVDFIPVISKVCNIHKIFYICWVVDNPCFQLFSDAIHNPWNRIFMFDYSQYEKFHPQNPKCTYHLPLACDYEKWSAVELTDEDRKNYTCDISFIGSTYEEKCMYNHIENIPDYIQGYVDGIISAQMNIYGYNLIEDALTDEFVKMFKECAQWYPLMEDYTEDLKAIVADVYIGVKCTEQERIATLRNISEHANLDLYTLSDVSRIPKANFRGGADSKTMMPQIMKCSKINLNMTSRPIRTGLPLRIFDILGLGGFLLTNYQAELPDLFEIGKDLAAYESQEDLINQIHFYLKHDDIRMEIAENGHKKVKELYTYEKRIAQIMETVFSPSNL